MHKHTRIAGLAAAGAAAVVLLSGCGGNGDSGDDKPANSTPAGDDKPAPGGDDSGDRSALLGLWTSKTGEGSPLVLSITDKQAALLGTHSCVGKLTDTAEPALALKCADGDTTRTAGAVEPSADGKTLKVSWSSGTTESFTKSADGELPEGMPTTLPDDVKAKIPAP